MFGNSNQDDVNNQDNQMPNISDDNGAPGLPTMGGQGSPFSTPVSQPIAPQPEPAVAPINPDHMIADHGTPDPIDPAMQQIASTPQTHDGGSDLVGIKQSALEQLSPLVSHLEQSAEEKFRTTMMMIQATDDQSLLKTAYESAQKIEDDKARAQALLDVINEINYFTQQNK